ncbi:MAG: hypothetical protein JNL09_10425 [Anaerolineales bacterium]|nr:hypothetical protein [Anaerolineales bacterium]
MSTIAHSPAQVTFSSRSFAFVFAVFAIISVGMVWAFTSPAAPKPVGPAATAMPTPPHSEAAVAAPAQPAVVNPHPAPVPVPTPEMFTAPTSASPERPASETVNNFGVSAVNGLALLLPAVLLMGLVVGLRRAASFQRNAFAR